MIGKVKRILAYLLCTSAGIAFLISILGMIFFAESGSKKDVLENGYKNIAGNYSAQAMHYVLDKNTEGLAELFKDTGFRFSIEKTEEEHSEIVFSNAPEEAKFIFQHRFYNTYPNFNTQNLLKSISYFDAEKDEYTEKTFIKSYVFDANKGIFYAKTQAGFFEIKYIYVEHENLMYDYKLQKIDGVYCYYNNYYKKLLDVSKREEWDSIRIVDSRTYIENYEVIEDSASIEERLYQGDFYILDGETIRYSITDNTEYMVYSYIENPDELRSGMFYKWTKLIDYVYQFEDEIGTYQVVSLLLFIITLGSLVYGTNATRETLTFLQKVPVCTYTFIMFCIEIGIVAFLVILFDEIGRYYSLTLRMYITILMEVVFVAIIFLLFFITNMTARIKAKSFWRYSEFYYLWIPFTKCKKRTKEFYAELQRNGSLVMKTSIFMAILFFMQFFVLLQFDYYNRIIPWFLFYKLIEIPVVLIVILQMDKLQKGAKRIADGNLAEPIDTTKMFWEFRKHGEYINQSGEGISLAVEERIKSERLKTELITNVSHDIKTPLTSIINYVDLIKKENITDETLLEYIEVLDRQSARLKKLIEDLMEASKASTGNLACNMEEVNLTVFLGQLVGEFEEKLNQIGLEVIITKPEEVLYIQADGRHLWRIMENLMNNIYKYSLPQSRVYINLEKHEQMVALVFKNISKTQLNISSDELMERFVRGDSSRNTEGNGLGLSIAQSLAELLGGTMKLEIDGDLFKVTLQFMMSNTDTF